MIIPPALRILPRNASEHPAGSDRPGLRAIEVAGDGSEGAGRGSVDDIDIDDFVVDWQPSLVTGPSR